MPESRNSKETSIFEPDSTHRDPDTVQMVRPGERVGKLCIIGHIASGGMADIYKARHEELEVIRAIKILKPGHSHEEKCRFQTEAKISAHLDHPNIIKIYNVDIWQDALPFIEMEYLEGITLADLVKKHRRLPFDFSIAACIIICRALEYAQEQNLCVYGITYKGLVHRDIKPANILLSKSGIIKLADFGIALPGNTSIHTVGPNTMGTYSYLSPEQLDGKPLDQRSDIYSLGICLYEIIAGFKAYPSHSLPDLIKNKLSGSYRPIQAIIPHTPKSLVKLVDKAIALDRDKRFASLKEFREFLEKTLAEITDRNTQEVITAFVSQPTQLLPIQYRHRFFLFNPEWLIGAGVGMAVIAILSIVLLTGVYHGNSGKSVPGKDGVANPDSIAAVFEPADTVGITETETPETFSMSVYNRQDNTDLTSLTSKDTVRGEKKHAPASAGNRAKQKMPADAVKKLEELIKKKNYAAAIAMAADNTGDDGYFHLLLGQAYFYSGDFVNAETYFNKAQTTRSGYESDTKCSATYYGAINRVEIYNRKPNLANKQIAVNGLRNYRLIFCAGEKPDNRCGEIAVKIKELE
jgi:serine/threonine-protein kinase